MSELKATPGPYKVHVNSAGSIEVVIGDSYAWRGNEYLCIGIVTEEQVERREQRKATAVAHLIAAAPELYEALNNLLSKLSVDDEEGLFEYADPVINAREALAKARGG